MGDLIGIDDAVRALKAVIRPHARLVVVHSNVGSFGPMSDPIGDLLAALEQALPEGCTLAMPTFTYDFCTAGRFDAARTPSEMGVLTERFRTLPGVIRTPHPIFSFAVYGPLAERLARCNGKTCWGEDTPFACMQELDADVVMLGCSWERCTLFHRVEELSRVPYRYPKTFSGAADYGDGLVPVAAEMLVRRLDVPVENRFGPLVDELRSRGLMRSAVLGRGMVEAAGAADIVAVGTELLSGNPLALLGSAQGYLEAERRWRVVLLSSANLGAFADYFEAEANHWIKDGTALFLPPFDQYRQQLIAPESDLLAFDPEWMVFLERAEDVLGSLLFDPLGAAGDSGALERVVDARIKDYLESIALARERTQARLLVLTFDVPACSPFALADGATPLGQGRVVELANDRLRRAIAEIPDVWTLDFGRLRAAFGRAASMDERFWYIGRIPFSRDFSIHLSRQLVGAMLAIAGRTARAVVVDLDNTLWHGVIGEDGLEGIQVGGDFPGNAYADFQRALAALARRGIALAISSRNTESLAMEVFDKHPGMVLKATDFAARRINWADKASNFLEIADELSLGLGSICFLDDEPRERELIRQQLPDVFVPDLPNDPARFAAFLLDLPCLQMVDVTDEDIKRSKQYRARARIEQRRKRFGSMEDFYRDLRMTMFFERYKAENQARILQLVQKTNQFNTTTRRHSEADLRALLAEGASVWSIGLKDRFGEKEIIGVIIVGWPKEGDVRAEIESFLLSCRVLGRGVETGVLGWVADRARERGVKILEGLIVPTDRNQPACGVYADHGFSEVGDNCFELALSDSGLTVPDWFTIETDEGG